MSKQDDLKSVSIPLNEFSRFNDSSIHVIPREILFHIFEFLEEEDLMNVCEVCKDWYNVASSNKLWTSIGIDRVRLLKEGPESENKMKLKNQQIKIATKRNRRKDLFRNIITMFGGFILIVCLIIAMNMIGSWFLGWGVMILIFTLLCYVIILPVICGLKGCGCLSVSSSLSLFHGCFMISFYVVLSTGICTLYGSVLQIEDHLRTTQTTIENIPLQPNQNYVYWILNNPYVDSSLYCFSIESINNDNSLQINIIAPVVYSNWNSSQQVNVFAACFCDHSINLQNCVNQCSVDWNQQYSFGVRIYEIGSYQSFGRERENDWSSLLNQYWIALQSPNCTVHSAVAKELISWEDPIQYFEKWNQTNLKRRSKQVQAKDQMLSISVLPLQR